MTERIESAQKSETNNGPKQAHPPRTHIKGPCVRAAELADRGCKSVYLSKCRVMI